MSESSAEYSAFFYETTDALCRFGDTISGIQFDEQNDPVEIYTMLTIFSSLQHSMSIAILLENGLYAEPILLSRLFMEHFFNLRWATAPTTNDERNRRVHQLEATPYYRVAKEARVMDRDRSPDSSDWSQAKAAQLRENLQQIAESHAELLEDPDPKKVAFMNAPPFASRIDARLRTKYYHLYLFSSMFVHPSPALKRAHFKVTPSNTTPEGVIDEPMKQSLAYGLLFVRLLLAYAVEIFQHHNPERHADRLESLRQITDLANRANKGYYGENVANAPDPG
jgi:hypothetical protein